MIKKYDQKNCLIIAFALNFCMFFIEISAAFYANSLALFADAFDMLADAAMYLMSLWVLCKSDRLKTYSAMIKAVLMALFGAFVLIQTAFQIFDPALPNYTTISLIGMLALLVNVTCVWLLTQFRNADLNMRSIWLCSRNDMIANLLIILAGAGVWLSHSAWPDIFVGIIIGLLFISSAAKILHHAVQQGEHSPRHP